MPKFRVMAEELCDKISPGTMTWHFHSYIIMVNIENCLLTFTAFICFSCEISDILYENHDH